MADYIDDLETSKGVFAKRTPNKKLPKKWQHIRCVEEPNILSEPNHAYLPENPILARATELSDIVPWTIQWTNTNSSGGGTPMNFELFNGNVNFNAIAGGFKSPANIGESNDYQTWVGDGWLGSTPPTNPYVSAQDGTPVTGIGTGAMTWQDMLYETMTNPITISNIFFKSGNGINIILNSSLHIEQYDVSGNLKKDTKQLLIAPYVNNNYATVDSPITMMVDGYTKVYLEKIPYNKTVEAIIYPRTNVEAQDCLGGYPEAMMI